MKIEIEVIETIRRLVHPHAHLATMAHDFEHQVGLLYGEDLDEDEEREGPAAPPADDRPRHVH
jgi:hypothetical protein